jgi:hypothetical protein
MGLTVTEKEHWKDRIRKRIDAKVEQLLAEHPEFLPRITAKARVAADKSLNIAGLRRKIKKLQEKQAVLAEQIKTAQTQLVCRVTGITEAKYRRDSYHYDRELETAYGRRLDSHKAMLMAKAPLGRQILGLQQEAEEILDTVWLATSPVQVKALWEQVLKLLNEKPTKLQAKAMALPPMASDRAGEGDNGMAVSLTEPLSADD